MDFDLFNKVGARKKADPQKRAIQRQRNDVLNKSNADPIDKPEDANTTPDEALQFDNAEEIEHAFKKGSINWPNTIVVGGLKYGYIRSSKNIIDMIKRNKPGYVIYTTPQANVKRAADANMGQWMVFLFKADGPSRIVPQGLTFTTQARGDAIYETQEVIGDVALLKIALPSGVIALKGKVDTGAEISSLHVDSKPQIVGDSVKFENHNASGNIITAPLVSQQAVKSADGGIEYRPVIELDIEINGKRITKAQFNLNNRSKMEYEVLIGQNILEKSGFLVDPNINHMKENDENALMDLNLPEEEFDNLMMQISEFIEEDNKED